MASALVDMGVLTARDLDAAYSAAARGEARLADVLLSMGLIRTGDLARAQSAVTGAARFVPDQHIVDIRLIDQLGADACIHLGILPLNTPGGATLVATARPERFAAVRRWLATKLGPVRMVIATEDQMHACLLPLRQRALARGAEVRVDAAESCRGWSPRRFGWLFGGVMLAALAFAALAPVLAFSALAVWAVVTLIATTALRSAATLLQMRAMRRGEVGINVDPAPNKRLPVVTLLVPLFREREIAATLVRRLAALDYPAGCLDICLVVEEDDLTTQDTLAGANLLPSMRQIVVPRAMLQTKPRALNYALDFARGSIVGIYDAEDLPAPDQIRRVAERFLAAGHELACVQAVLDFYNAGSNWLSRCFTVEYATWFRIILPGLERMGLVVPLGGTSLFFRRAAIEALGGWDAHNVTEDADLGLRLARHGYRTELISSVTQEEANCRFWPWVKQRARWLKGYAVTYAVHMRRPLRLLRQLGAWRFLGVQVVFLGTLSQFVLAPVLWSFWLIPLGLPYPLVNVAPWGVLVLLGALFLLSEVITIGCIAAATTGRSWLIKWVPTLHFYFPLGALAAYRGLLDMVVRPYYWDKTAHGIYDAPPE